MKMKLHKILSLALLSGAVLLLSNCDNETKNPESPLEKRLLDALKGTWTPSAPPTMDGNERIDFLDISLIIEGSYATEGNIYNYYFSDESQLPDNSIWPNKRLRDKGDWKFHPETPETTIIRLEDNLPITYTVTENELTLSFNCSGCEGFPGGGRTSSVSGSWVFTFSRQ